jgi:hypothetical protein
MIKRTVALVLIFAFLIAVSGCARVVTKPASEVRLLSARKQSAYKIRELILTDGTSIAFGAYNSARIKEGRIEGHVPVKDIPIPKEKVETIRRNRRGHPTEISTSEGLIYRISRAAEEPDRLIIRTGYRERVFGWNEVSFLQMVKQNAGATFAVAVVGSIATFILLVLKGAGGIGP